MIINTGQRTDIPAFYLANRFKEQIVCVRNPFNKEQVSRKECACYLSGDIGAYDSCGHLCRYCYANNDIEAVKRNMKLNDPNSPFLIGNYNEADVIHDVEMKSYIDNQLSFF